MIEGAKNTMQAGAPKKKELFHFSGDGVFHPKAIFAETIVEAEKIWHATKTLISQTSSAPASQPAIPASPPDPKVEDKQKNR